MLNEKPSPRVSVLITQKMLLDLTPPRLDRCNIEVFSDNDGNECFVPGIGRTSPITMRTTLETHGELLEAFHRNEPTQFRVLFDGDVCWQFDGHVISVRVDPLAVVSEIRITGRLLMKTDFVTDSTSPCFGLPVLTMEDYAPHHPNCRCVCPYIQGVRRKSEVTFGIDWAEQKEKKPMKVRNRFYVASPSVTTEKEQGQDNTADTVAFATQARELTGQGKWTRKKLADVVTQAEAILAKNPQQDHVAIVQIVRVVRRKVAPIVVETVRG